MSSWHILGVGAMGQLFAHHLRQAGVEVTLLLRSAEALRTFDGNITLYRREPRPPRTGADEADDNIGTFGPPSVRSGLSSPENTRLLVPHLRAAAPARVRISPPRRCLRVLASRRSARRH